MALRRLRGIDDVVGEKKLVLASFRAGRVQWEKGGCLGSLQGWAGARGKAVCLGKLQGWVGV
jgi:hypothetical protein